jgi:hypothetical protein
VTFTWTLRPEPATDVPTQEGFSAQGDAESWIGMHWRTLLEAGVTSVVLTEGARTVYEMSLEDA